MVIDSSPVRPAGAVPELPPRGALIRREARGSAGAVLAGRAHGEDGKAVFMGSLTLARKGEDETVLRFLKLFSENARASSTATTHICGIAGAQGSLRPRAFGHPLHSSSQFRQCRSPKWFARS